MKKKYLFFTFMTSVIILSLSGCLDFFIKSDPLPPTSGDQWSFLPDFKPGESVYENYDDPDNTPPINDQNKQTVPDKMITDEATTKQPIIDDGGNETMRDPSKANEPLTGYYCCEEPGARDKYYWPFKRDAQGYICSPGHIYHPNKSEKDCSNPLTVY